MKFILMQSIFNKSLYGFLWLVSKLPWFIFYRVSDFCYVVVYYVIGYRKAIVTENLKEAFPEKSIAEIKTIRRKFFRFMCDMFLENIKSISISDKEIKKRFKVINTEVFDQIHQSPKSNILLAAHYASFEWSNSMGLGKPYQFVAAYKPIRNPFFNDLIVKLRSKYGAEVVASKEVLRFALRKERAEKGQRIYGLIADQSPGQIKKDTLFLPFMGREVPVFTGGEFLAQKFNMSVSYLKVTRVKRGFYEAEVMMLQEDVSSNKNFEATRAYYKIIEAQIHEKPELYLWSHKRWKYAKKSYSLILQRKYLS